MMLGESLIQEELPGLLIRLQQKPLKLTKKGRPSIASIRSIRKKLNIQEFYPESDQAEFMHIRTSSIVGLLALSKKLNTDNIVELIKRLFAFEFVNEFHLPIHLLGYLKGMSRVDSYYLQSCGQVYTDLIGNLPLGEWKVYEEIERSLKMQGFDVFPILGHGMYDLSVEVPDTASRYSDTRSVRVYPYLTEKLVLWPSFRAAMFMMASWGLIDMIYEEPDISILSETANSPYDGIKAIRLNELGAYVLRQTKSYESNIKPPFILELDNDSLSILLTEGDQERAAMAIASFAKPLGNKRFYTDANLFLGDCKSPADLDHKFAFLKRYFLKIFRQLEDLL